MFVKMNFNNAKKCFQERNGIFSTNKQFLDAKQFYKCPVNVITNKIYLMF